MTPLKNDNHDLVLGHDDRTYERCYERCYWKGRALKAESLLEEKPTANRLVVFTRNGPELHVNDPGEWGIDDDGNFIAWHGRGKVLQVSASDFVAAELTTKGVA